MAWKYFVSDIAAPSKMKITYDFQTSAHCCCISIDHLCNEYYLCHRQQIADFQEPIIGRTWQARPFSSFSIALLALGGLGSLSAFLMIFRDTGVVVTLQNAARL